MCICFWRKGERISHVHIKKLTLFGQKNQQNNSIAYNDAFEFTAGIAKPATAQAPTEHERLI